MVSIVTRGDLIAEPTHDGILCPACGSGRSSVIDSRPSDGYIRRRRECDDCSHRFTTRERTGQRFALRGPEEHGIKRWWTGDKWTVNKSQAKVVDANELNTELARIMSSISVEEI